MKTSYLCYVPILYVYCIINVCCRPEPKKDTILIPASDNHIQYIGRFDFINRDTPVFMYSGCTIRTRFTGTSLRIHLLDDSLRNWFTVTLDDSLFILHSNRADGIYPVGNRLTNKPHSIEISRRTEWHGGNTAFAGFELDEGKNLLPAPRKKRTIEFIGNSITCGYGNEGKSHNEHFSYATENNYRTYGKLTADQLDAEYVAVCRSGIGMYQSYDGSKTFVQPLLYDEVAMNSKAKWNYQATEPDIVVIELGSNDLAKPLNSAAFINAYIQFIKTIRSNYPHTSIVCAAGPNEKGDRSVKFQSYVNTAVQYFALTDTLVHYFNFSPIESNGSDWHPDVKAHEMMAAELTAHLKNIMHW
ncbi:MAG TPA: SGNH/GDSL hydrolase family protein [Parafilimonas sp.]|nr:SGNH/GDSL hydrolase family protein [Parafilimonas sp.]